MEERAQCAHSDDRVNITCGYAQSFNIHNFLSNAIILSQDDVLVSELPYITNYVNHLQIEECFMHILFIDIPIFHCYMCLVHLPRFG